MSKFASGKNALGTCARSGRKMKLSDMVQDGYKPGLMVDPAWRDTRHPAERPVNMEEGIALRRPAPDIDDDSPGDNGETLAVALFSGLDKFGGGT